MNNQIRKQLDKIISQLEDLKNQIEEIKNEEELRFDNMPQQFQDGERGEKMQSGIDYLD
jgi:hypothetical protein